MHNINTYSRAAQSQIPHKQEENLQQLQYDPIQVKGRLKRNDYSLEIETPNDQNFKCAFRNHQQPVLMVVVDPKLRKHERLLCSQCIVELESNKRTIGLNKAIEMTQENYKKKQEQREIVVDQNFKELEQLKNNLIQLKSFLNKNLDQMLEITKMWMTDLESYRLIEYNFDNEIQQLIDGQFKFEIESIVDEIKPLNMKWIPKLNQTLPQFSSFKEYSICQNILNNLSQKKKSQNTENNSFENIQTLQQQEISLLLMNRVKVYSGSAARKIMNFDKYD